MHRRKWHLFLRNLYSSTLLIISRFLGGLGLATALRLPDAMSLATTTTLTHTATTGTHTAPSTRCLVGQCCTALIGSLLHLLVMLLSDLLLFLGSFCGTHFCVILSSLLLRHELATVDLSVLISVEGESNKQRKDNG